MALVAFHAVNIVETLHYVERKHAQGVRIFHLAQSLHAKAAGINVAFSANRAWGAI